MDKFIDIKDLSLIVGGRRITDFVDESSFPKVTWSEPDKYKSFQGIMGLRTQTVKVAGRYPSLEFDLLADGGDYAFIKALQMTDTQIPVTYNTIVGENYLSLNAVLRQVGEDKEDQANEKVGRKIIIDMMQCVETPVIGG